MPEKHYKQLRREDRETIEEMLNTRSPISAIARQIGCSTATISREISRNRRDDGYKGSRTAWKNNNCCALKRHCNVKGLCAYCTSPKSKSCSTCQKSKCMALCERFEEQLCEQISKSPHVCNGCVGGSCRLHRYRYSAKDAQAMAEGRSREARSGLDCTAEGLERSEAIIREGISKGQGIDHIFNANKDELSFAKSSFYRHVRNGDVSIIPLDLRKAVKYKLRNKAQGSSRSNIPLEVLEGRRYEDFCSLDESERARVVECDCMEGPASENDAILTMHFKALHFQVAFKLRVKDAAHVLECFVWLASVLGDEFPRCFGILLFDRGSEFTCVLEVEALASKGKIRCFFTDGGRPDQKGACEKNHVECRKVIEKGTSLAQIGTWELSEVMSHVNSSLRDSIFGKSPMELSMGVLPKELFDHLGYRLVAPNDVVLRPELLDSIKAPFQLTAGI